MTPDLLPPIRKAGTLPCAGGTLSYDTWGALGRPVLLLHSVLFDRRMWWPVAAELHRHCAPVAADLPGHGQSPGRARYDAEELIDEMGALLYKHRYVQAPIVVGHGASAGMASLFAKRFATHAVVLVDPPDERPLQPASATTLPDTTETGTLLGEMQAADVPSHFRHLAEPSPDRALLQAYSNCIDVDPWISVAFDAPLARVNRGTLRLAVYSQVPLADPRHVLRRVSGKWRYSVYNTAGRFPHLTNVGKFAADIRSLL